MNCIDGIIGLFKTAPCAAGCLAAICIVIGAIASCVACRLLGRPCQKGSKCAQRHSPCRAQQTSSKSVWSEQRPEKHHPAPADGSIEIYVGNLSYEMTDDQLRKEFEQFGKVNMARVITNRQNGKSKGYGFVHMPNRAEVDAAVAALNDKEILGRKMRCNPAKNVVSAAAEA